MTRSLFAIAIISMLALSFCSDNPTVPAGQGTLKISLTDAPARYDAVNITFSEISAHIDSNWINVTVDTQTVNLLDYSNGNTIEIGTATVPAGRYSQVRIKILNAEVVVDGASQPVTVPSGSQSGLKLLANFEIVEGTTHEVVLDFDANRSIVSTGPPSNPRSYILKPTIRIISEPLTGSIFGNVSNFQHLPVAFALSGPDTITSTQVSATGGAFRLPFLPAGDYTVTFEDTLNQSAVVQNVDVVPGMEKGVGEILLQ